MSELYHSLRRKVNMPFSPQIFLDKIVIQRGLNYISRTHARHRIYINILTKFRNLYLPEFFIRLFWKIS